MANWTEDNPSAGDLYGLQTAAEQLRTRGNLEIEYGNMIINETTSTLAVWSGESADAWAGMSIRATDPMHTFGQACVDGASAIDTYVDRVEEMQRTYRKKHTEFTDAVEDAEHLGLTCLPTPLEGELNTVMCFLPTPGPDGRPNRTDLYTAQTSIDTAIKQIRAMISERREHDHTLANALHQMTGDWPAQSAAFRAVGITNPAQMQPQNLAGPLAKYAAGIAAQEGPLTPEQTRVLNEFFTRYGTDPDVMAQLFTQLGGEHTGDLIEVLNRTVTDPNHDTKTLSPETIAGLAGAVRAGLAVGSQNWTGLIGGRFADGLIGSPPRMEITGFLFDGPPYLGETLTVRAAEIIDTHERVTGARPRTTTFTLTSLYDQYFRDPAATTHPGNDTAGRILQTLGQYPERAANFLGNIDPTAGDSTVGADRIAYWYGKRDWSVSDHFAGPGGLLEGAQRAAGGPNDPNVTAEAYNRASTIISQAIDALSTNDSYTAANLSDPAARAFARALAPYLDDFAKRPLALDNNASDDWLVGRDISIPRPPNVEGDALARVFGGLMGREASASMIREVTQRVIAEEYDAALASGDPGALQQALDRIAGLAALVSGSGLGAPIAAAEQNAADAKADRDALAGFLGSFPVPGPAAAGIAASLLLDNASAFADHLSEQNLDTLRRSADDTQDALANMFHTQMTANILTAQGAPFTPPPSWDDALTHAGGDTGKAAEAFGNATGDWLYTYENAIPDNLRDAISGAANHYSSHLFGTYEWSRK